MMKRFGPDGALEANFVRRIEHEVRRYRLRQGCTFE